MVSIASNPLCTAEMNQNLKDLPPRGKTHTKNMTLWLMTKASKISRSDQKFPQPKIFKHHLLPLQSTVTIIIISFPSKEAY